MFSEGNKTHNRQLQMQQSLNPQIALFCPYNPASFARTLAVRFYVPSSPSCRRWRALVASADPSRSTTAITITNHSTQVICIVSKEDRGNSLNHRGQIESADVHQLGVQPHAARSAVGRPHLGWLTAQRLRKRSWNRAGDSRGSRKARVGRGPPVSLCH